MCTFQQSQMLTNIFPEATPLEKHLLYSLMILIVYLITSYHNQIPNVQSDSGWVEAVMYHIESMNLNMKERNPVVENDLHHQHI